MKDVILKYKRKWEEVLQINDEINRIFINIVDESDTV